MPGVQQAGFCRRVSDDFIDSILSNFSKGSNFGGSEEGIHSDARGDESISNCFDFIMEIGGKLVHQSLVRIVRWKCHVRDPTLGFSQYMPQFSRVSTIIRDKFTVVVLLILVNQ